MSKQNTNVSNEVLTQLADALNTLSQVCPFRITSAGQGFTVEVFEGEMAEGVLVVEHVGAGTDFRFPLAYQKAVFALSQYAE